MRLEKSLVQIAGIALLGLACGKKSGPTTPPPTTPGIIIPETTRILDATDMGMMVHVSEGLDTLIFSGATPRIASIKAGDVVVSDIGEGFLRTVVTATRAGLETILETRQAALTDAVTSGHIVIRQQIRASDIAFVRTPHGAGIAPVSENQAGEIVIPLNHVVYDDDGNFGTVEDQLMVNGEIVVTPVFVFDCEIDDARIARLDVGFEGNVRATLSAGFRLAGLEFSKSKTLVTVRTEAIRALLGPLGILITPEFTIKAKMDLAVGADIGDVSIAASSGFAAHVLYVAGNVTYSGSATEAQYEVEPFSPSLNFEGAFAIGPEFSLGLFGQEGAYLFVPGMLEVDGDLLKNPWLTVHGGISADIGLRLDAFNGERGTYTRGGVLRWRAVILQSPTACFSTAPTGGSAGMTIRADATCSHSSEHFPRGLQVRWDWNGDGTWDTPYSAERTAQHSYDAPGRWHVRMQAIDDVGLWGIESHDVDAAPSGDKTPPVSCFTVQPGSGPPGTDFSFDASCATDAEDPPASLMFRWDWDSDETWDTEYSSARTASHRYATVGAKLVKLETRDSAGLTSTATRSLTIIAEPSNCGLVSIQPDTFQMGCPASELGADWLGRERQHSVTLTKAFCISPYEVTQAEWETVMGWNDVSQRGPMRPIYNVTWYDCIAYCNARSQAEGLTPAYSLAVQTMFGLHISSAMVEWNRDANGFRLPTEAEWEFACRAGSTTAFANGPITRRACELDPNLDAMAWYCGNSYDAMAIPQTREVMTKAPNSWGLYDMHGNVREWCWDWWGGVYQDGAIDPTGPETGSQRHIRGGMTYGSTEDCRSAKRSALDPGTTGNYFVGLRVVRSSF